MTEDLITDLERHARNRDDAVSTLLERAARHLREQHEQKTALKKELEETNEGMVALTLELQEAERRYRSLFEDAAEGIYRTSADARRYQLVNQSMAEILGYESPADVEETVDIQDVFVDDDRYREYQNALTSEEQLDGFEYQIEQADGERRWVTDSVRALTDEDGQPVYRGGVIDITEQKASEKKLKQRNEALEALNRVVRHDIRNDVQVISIHAEGLEAYVDEEGLEALERIQRTTDNITEITRDAAAFVEALTSDETDELEPVQLGTILETELEHRRDAYPEATFEVIGSIPFVQVQANEMLSSVLRNVLNNAVVHNDSKTPVVEVDVTVEPDTVIVRIADNGPGIPDELKEQVFGKGEQGLDSEGTGIGLYLVSHLLSVYDGTVRTEDNEPRGTVFELEFVRAQ